MIQGVTSDTVLVNNTDAAYQAVSCLIKKGHSRVAMITGPKSVLTAKERQIGYLKAISDHGLIYDDDLFISDQNDFATGYRGCERLIAQEHPPMAIFTTNYNITMGCVTAARERGLRIPEDFDIFGFDCVDICTMMKPPLPVVQQPEEEIGRMAATHLIERLNGFAGEPRIARLPCKLVQK
jgi:LacI family transcriptional regulator